MSQRRAGFGEKCILNQAGLGTLLIDLLTPGEQMDPASVFDIGLLARRLLGATRWMRTQPGAAGLPIGCLGTRTAAAAARWAAAEPGNGIAAVSPAAAGPTDQPPRGQPRPPDLTMEERRWAVALALAGPRAGLRLFRLVTLSSIA